MALKSCLQLRLTKDIMHNSFEPGHEKMCLMSYANNKGADQPAHPRSLISAFVVRCLDSIMSLVGVTKNISLILASVAAQASLSLTWSETPEGTFSHDEAPFYPLSHSCREQQWQRLFIQLSPAKRSAFHATDRCKAVVLVLSLFSVASWFILRGVSCWVLPYS